MISGVSAVAPTAVDSLTAVVSNWETTDYTTRCVDALVGDGVPARRIVIVDNGSRDDSFDRLSERFTDALVLRLEENVGYARAMNHGARALPGSAYLLLNSDAFLHRRESVAAMLAALADETVGIVVPRLLNEDLTLQPTVMPTNSPAVALARASGLRRLIPNH
jgi:N-acetylglucosaminyl-diphospho-decaprenol L-rhamnosyltransferase